MINCPTVNQLQFLEALPAQAVHIILGADVAEPQFADDTLTAKLIEKIKMAPLQFLAVTLDGIGLFDLTTANKSDRDNTLQHLILSISWLAQLPCPTCLIVPADRLPADHPVTSYEDAFNWAFFAISRLATCAAEHSVTLAIENPAAGLFLSPLELRDFIDQINSPSLGVCFNPAHAADLGNPADWFAILNNRVRAVRIPETPARPANPELADFLTRLSQAAPSLPLIQDAKQ